MKKTLCMQICNPFFIDRLFLFRLFLLCDCGMFTFFVVLFCDYECSILFPLVVHSFDLVVSSVGILSIQGKCESGVMRATEDPMAILHKEYSVTIVLTFGLVTFPISFFSFFWFGTFDSCLKQICTFIH